MASLAAVHTSEHGAVFRADGLLRTGRGIRERNDGGRGIRERNGGGRGIRERNDRGRGIRERNDGGRGIRERNDEGLFGTGEERVGARAATSVAGTETPSTRKPSDGGNTQQLVLWPVG